MRIFQDNDQGYLRWVAGNPAGYVINTERPPNPGYLMLHRADCYTISGTPARGRYWTVDLTKVCSLDLRELEMWAMSEVGGKLQPCKICSP